MGISLTAPEGAIRGSGNFAVLAAPEGTVVDLTKPTPTELNGAATKDITYSMPPGGFRAAPSFEELDDARLTNPTDRKKKGKYTGTLEMQIVAGSATEVAAAILVEGADLDIIERRYVEHDEDFAVGQKTKIHPITVISVDDDDPVEGNFTKTVKVSYRRPPVNGVVTSA